MFKLNNKPQRRLWKPINNKIIDMECKDRKIRAMWLPKATTSYYYFIEPKNNLFHIKF